MRTTNRIGAGALGLALATGTLLSAGIGTAAAQEACDPEAYPPVQCEVQGGARGLPLAVSATIGTPGSDVVARVAEACNPRASVALSLVRVSTGAQPVRIGTAQADEDGGFDVAGSIPADSPSGTFVLYGACALGTDVAVYTTSFVVERPPATAAARTSGQGGSADAASTDATSAGSTSDAPAAVRAAAVIAATDVPDAWTPPTAWAAAPAERAAVAEAVNLRLAALRTSLPAADAVVAAPEAAPSTDNDLVYAAAAGAAFLALGAAARRRRTATTDEVAQ